MGKVEIEIDGKIARIYLNRPKVLNAIDTELPSLLSKAVKEAGDNDNVHLLFCREGEMLSAQGMI